MSLSRASVTITARIVAAVFLESGAAAQVARRPLRIGDPHRRREVRDLPLGR